MAPPHSHSKMVVFGSRRSGEFEHRTGIFEGAYRAWSHLGSLEPTDLHTKSYAELDPLNCPADYEYDYEALPRIGLEHPFVQAILSPWLGPDTDEETIVAGLVTLRTWWQHRRNGQTVSSHRAMGAEKMKGVMATYTRHFFSLLYKLILVDGVQPPRSWKDKLRNKKKWPTKSKPVKVAQFPKDYPPDVQPLAPKKKPPKKMAVPNGKREPIRDPKIEFPFPSDYPLFQPAASAASSTMDISDSVRNRAPHNYARVPDQDGRRQQTSTAGHSIPNFTVNVMVFNQGSSAGPTTGQATFHHQQDQDQPQAKPSPMECSKKDPSATATKDEQKDTPVSKGSQVGAPVQKSTPTNDTDTEDEDETRKAPKNYPFARDKRLMILPEDYVPSENTVIMGRGKRWRGRKGNKQFRMILEAEAQVYQPTKARGEKAAAMLPRAINWMLKQNPDGICFVKNCPVTNRWYQLTEKASRYAVAQAFRDTLRMNAGLIKRKGKKTQKKSQKQCLLEEAVNRQQQQQQKQQLEDAFHFELQRKLSTSYTDPRSETPEEAEDESESEDEAPIRRMPKARKADPPGELCRSNYNAV